MLGTLPPDHQSLLIVQISDHCSEESCEASRNKGGELCQKKLAVMALMLQLCRNMVVFTVIKINPFYGMLFIFTTKNHTNTK